MEAYNDIVAEQDPSKVVNALFKFGNTKSGEQQDVVEVGPTLYWTTAPL